MSVGIRAQNKLAGMGESVYNEVVETNSLYVEILYACHI